MFGTGIHSPEDRRFVGQADGVVDDILAREPVRATLLGDHRFDSRLPDHTADGIDEYIRVLGRYSTFLQGVDDRAMSRVTVADLQVLRAGVARRIFELSKIQPHLWNPLVWNPADSLFSLVTRDFAPAPERARSLVCRLEGVAAFLDSGRHTLENMPRVHVETAMAQMKQIEPMLAESLGPLAAEPGVVDAVDSAIAAVDVHIAWLGSKLPVSERSPSLGPRLYAGVLRYLLESDLTAEQLSAQAYEDLDRVSEELASLSAKFLGRSMADPDICSRALDKIASQNPVAGEDVLAVCGAALRESADFITERDLVTMPQVDVRIEVMPAVRRGIAVAYCDAPGVLERSELPTIIGIAPVPESWSPQRRESFFREYNQVLLNDLMVHEGLPGHLLQSTWARRADAPTTVRAAMPSELFVEGWAVYAEEMMARNGYSVDSQRRQSFRIIQLKMQLRTILNTIIDVGVHAQGMGEPEVRRLLTTRGFQQEGEVAGKWRRVQLSYGQLSTYYLGYRGVAELVQDLGKLRKGWGMRQVHDSILAHGSVSPQHLRGLTGLE